MSYILDALKKAEAERSPGAAIGPALASPLPSLPASATAPVWRSAWPWLACGALAGILIGFAWLRAAAPAMPAMPAMPAPEVAEVAAAAPTPVPPQAEAAPEPGPAPEQPDEENAVPPARKKPAVKKAPAPIATVDELPAAIQQQIPALKVGGYIYSANKADRSVLINGRLLREGDEAAPGLILERMQPDGMVLSYRGYHYRRGY